LQFVHPPQHQQMRCVIVQRLVQRRIVNEIENLDARRSWSMDA
jgi:hypothetical protein